MKNKVILLSSDKFGKGNGDDLGESLLDTFFTLLKQREDLPEAVFCINSGVFALTSDSLVSLQLRELEALQVKVYACKTCVEYYDVEERLTAGEISSMSHFIELAAKYEIITIS